jgi:SP family xylose:H+ symportor-like MFS transporter
MAMSYFFIARFLPETKGVSLEKMEEHILGSKA